jgi:hypothetical protein
MYRAKALNLVSIGDSIPACIARVSLNTVLVTANVEQKEAKAAAPEAKRDKRFVGSVVSIDFSNGEVKTVLSGFRSVFGIAKIGDKFAVSDPQSHGIWLLTLDGTRSPFIGCRSQGTADGLALECELSVPLGIAVAGSTAFWVQSDGRLRLFSYTDELCKFIESTRQWGQVFGILDPRVRRNVDQRRLLRSTPFLEGVTTLQGIVADRTEWYAEARQSLGLPETAKGLKGPEGVPCFGTFEAWQTTFNELQDLHQRLVEAGLTEFADRLLLSRINTMPVEHTYGEVALGRNHSETQQTFLPLLNRGREEHVVSTCSPGFAHCTTTQPYALNCAC